MSRVEPEMRKTIEEVAREAGKILLDNFGRVKKVEKKGRQFVSNIDLESENRIMERIQKEFPEHNILSEEVGKKEKSSEYTWIIDPLDGTHNYIHCIPIYAVSIALRYRAEVVLGAVFIPPLDEMYQVEGGEGAFLNGKRLKVSNAETENIMATHGGSIPLNPGHRETLMKIAPEVRYIRNLGSAATHLAFAAAGKTDLAVEQTIKPWDIAAGCLLVEEAGGKVTDLSGKGWRPESKDIIAGKKNAHRKILKIVGRERDEM